MLNQKTIPVALKQILPISLIFLFFSAVGIFNHELWLDEAQHFLIARDSDSLKEVYYNMQYDGHVRLWNFMLFFITHYISSNPLSMQVFHLLLINSTVFIFLRYAPFRLLTKLLIIGGYFFLYEYDVISRNYTPGILLLFACCVLLADLRKNILWIAVLLILMCNVHLFFLFAATSIAFYVFLRTFHAKQIDLRFFIFLSLFAIGIFSVIAQINIPPDNTYFHPEKTAWNSTGNFFSAFYGLSKGFLPIPFSKNGDFWNHYLYDLLPTFIKLIIAAFILVYTVALFYKNKPVLLFYLSSTLMLMIFLYVSQMRASRYFGIFFIFFLAALWLDGYEKENIFSVSVNRLKGKKFLFYFSYFILTCHLFSGIYAYASDVARPFSGAKNTIAFIKTNHLDSNMIVVDGYGGGPALSAYLGTKVFYLNIDKPGSYCYWKKSYFEVPQKPLAELLDESAYINTHSDFVLVSVRQVTSNEIHSSKSKFQFQRLAVFDNNIIKPDYYVYKVMMQKEKTP